MHTSRDALVNFIAERIVDLGETPRSVSLRLGKGATYLADFMGDKASPKALPEDVRLDLSRILGTDEDNLRFQRPAVNHSVGNNAQDIGTAKTRRQKVKREPDMSFRDVYIRLGKLEQRVAQLEDQQQAPTPPKGKTSARP
jgi:hypothetical protein